MGKKQIKVLLIEDNKLDARMFDEMLSQISRHDIELQQVECLADGTAEFRRGRFDVVLLDLTLPDSVGLETLDKVAAQTSTPIVVLTGVNDEETGLEAVRRGAQDYLLKGEFGGRLLHRSICYAIERKRSARERELLQQQVLDASDREQRRISQELHDSVGQELTGLGYLARGLAKKLDAASLPYSDDANSIATGVQHTLRSVYNAVRGLMPVEIDSLGLMAALQRLAAKSTEVFQVDCSFVSGKPVTVEDNQTATHLYRIAQESVNNAVKHAYANHILISLESNKNCLRLQITDDGIGIGDRIREAGGMGLHIMRYRANSIAATLEIASDSNIGTTVTCTLDLDNSHVSSKAYIR